MNHFFASYPHPRHIFRNIQRKITQTIFPDYCLLCQSPGDILCETCLSDISEIKETPAGGVSVFPYRHPGIKKALRQLKYYNRSDIAEPFAPYLYDALLSKISEDMHFGSEYESAKIVLIPIPMFRKNKRNRNKNHALVVAGEILKEDDANVFTLSKKTLVKKYETPSQAHTKNRAERLRNPVGSFEIKNPEAVRGKSVVLVDDITTTGATLREAKTMFEHAGARRVEMITIAH